MNWNKIPCLHGKFSTLLFCHKSFFSTVSVSCSVNVPKPKPPPPHHRALSFHRSLAASPVSNYKYEPGERDASNYGYPKFFGTASSPKPSLPSQVGPAETKPSKPLPDPRLKGLKYELSGYDDTWFNAEWFGTSYYISNEWGSDLLYQGTLCASGSSGDACDFRFIPDGIFKWRVTGALDEYSDAVAWRFCDTVGGASNELLFKIGPTGCKPLALLGLSNVCSYENSSSNATFLHLVEDDNTTETLAKVVALQGSFYLMGSELPLQPSEASVKILRDTLSQEFHDALPAANVRVVSDVLSIEYIRMPSSTHERVLMPQSSDEYNDKGMKVSFEVRLNARDFGVDESSAEEIHTLASACKGYLQKSMVSGLFVARVVASARSSGVSELQKVLKAELIDLFNVESHHHREKALATSIQLYLSLFIIIGVVLGTILFVLFSMKLSSTTSASDRVDASSIASSLPSEMKLGKIHDKFSLIDRERGYGAVL